MKEGRDVKETHSGLLVFGVFMRIDDARTRSDFMGMAFKSGVRD